MIISENIEMKWNSYNKKYYMDLGYVYTKMKDCFIIDIKDLNKNSHYKVIVKCDICGIEKEAQYKHYNITLDKHNIYCCSKCRYHNIKKTNLKKYGVENVSHLDDVKEKLSIININNWEERKLKSEKTCLLKYGYKNPFQNNEIIELIKVKSRNTKIEKGLIIPDNKLSKFQLYKKEVINKTYKIKKYLLEKWDGYDYYDGEYIKENFNNYHYHHSNYPNIDHKISIKYGFINNISSDIIANIDNLCVTKKKLNVSKSTLSDTEFKKKIKIKL